MISVTWVLLSILTSAPANAPVLLDAPELSTPATMQELAPQGDGTPDIIQPAVVASPQAPAQSVVAEPDAKPHHHHRHPCKHHEQDDEEVSEPPAPPQEIGFRSVDKRAPIYADVLVLGELYQEDSDYRLTTRKTRGLEGAGGLFRIGATLNPNLRLGLRVQSFMRPTKKVLRQPAAEPGHAPWGSVQFGYAGPEVLFVSESGWYAAGSLGVAGSSSVSDLGCDDDMGHCDNDNEGRHHDDDIERGSLGAGAMVSVGYEWRLYKWFSLSAELFGGGYGGFAKNEKGTGGAVAGLGMGLGF